MTCADCIACVHDQSSCYASFSFYDQSGLPYSPLIVSWRLDIVAAGCSDTPIQDWTNFTPLGTRIQIPIPGSLNVRQVPCGAPELRQVTVKITTAGSNVRYDKALYELVALPQADLQ